MPAEPESHAARSASALELLWGIGRPHGAIRTVSVSCLAAVAKLLLLVPIPILCRNLFDLARPGMSARAAIGIGISILLLQAGSVIVTLWSRHHVLTAAKRIVMELRQVALRKLYTLSRSYHDRVTRGELFDRIVTQTDRVDHLISVLLGDLVPSIVIVGGIGALLLVVQWRLFLVAIALAPLSWITARIMGLAVRREIAKDQRIYESFVQGVWRALRGVDLTLTHGEETELAFQHKVLDDLRLSGVRAQLVVDAAGAFQQTLVMVSVVVVLVAGGIWTARGGLAPGEVVVFLAGLALVRGPINNVILSIRPVAEGRQALAQIVEYLAERDVDPYRGTRRLEFTGAIHIRDVTFGYADRPLFEGLDLELRPGETVALVGANGVGKTTLTRLILGLLSPQRGEIRADGVPYGELDLRHLRRQFGVLTQEPVLLAGSIWDNVTFGLPAARREDVDDAMRAAGGERLLAKLPQGYETPVGEEGALLSGGECQQLALARALLRRPRLLILDEPTNHLDARAVRRFLSSLPDRGAPATLLVTHDERVADCADRVVRLEDGRLQPVEQ